MGLEEKAKEINTLPSVDKPKIIEINLPDSSIQKTKRKYTPRGTKKEVKKVDNGIGENEISSLILGTFSLIALKGGEQWALTIDEATQISKPLNNILKKLDLLDKVSNVSDGVMLVMALGIILLPRIMITASNKKEAKANGTGTKPSRKESGNTKAEDGDNHSRSGKKPTYDISTNKALFSPGIENLQ